MPVAKIGKKTVHLPYTEEGYRKAEQLRKRGVKVVDTRKAKAKAKKAK